MSAEEDRLHEIEIEKAKNETELIPLDAHNKAIEQLRKQLRAMETATEEIKRKNYKIRLKNTDLDREADALISQIKLQKEAERQALEMQLKFDELEKATADAKWRIGLENGFK